MIENVYVIFDRTANVMLKPPMIERNDVVPIRMLTEAAMNKESVISKYPREFELIQIGVINLETMLIEAYEPRLCAVAVDLLPRQEEQ